MIIVVDKYQKAKTILTNSSPKALGYFGDKHREQLDGLLTYEFSTLASHPSAVHLVAGNSIIVRNLDKALMKFQILRTEEEQEDGKYVKRIYAENSAVGDLHGIVVKGTLLKSVGLEQAATHALQGTGWKLGRTEYAGLKDVDFSEYPTALAALYKIRDIYGLELEFTVHFDGVKVREQFVHFVKKRGQDTRKRFTYGKDLKGVTREEDRTDLVTALVGIGKADEQGNRLTFADYEATHSGYFKPKGQDWVGDDEALQKYGNNGKHIFGRFELSSVDNEYELLDKTAAELKKVCKPRMTYAVSVILLERLTKYPHEKVRLGDKIIVKDTTFDPALIVEARVIELVRSYTDPTEDSVVLGEFVPIFVDKNKQIEAIQQQINSNISKWEAKGETVVKSVNEPTNKTPDMLWLDLNAEPNIMKRWDDTAKRWVKASATTAEEIGAETPTGAQNKANKAQDNAAKDATNKANNAIDTASKDATNKADKAKQDAIDTAAQDATEKAKAAEEAAKSYVDGVVQTVESSMKEHAEQVAKNAEDAAQIFTEQYAQKELHIGTTAPADTTRLWLDTTNKLNVLKRYNPTTKVWDAATPTSAAEIGAETPAGAKSKADAAQKAAETAASNLAKAEAALAETSAKAHADSVVTAEEERRIKQAEENLAAAKKEAADKAKAAETAAKAAAALDATSKANAAQAAAIAEAQKKASAAETAAKTYADNIKTTVDANAKQYAEERAKAAQDAAKVFTESYAQKEIKIQNTAPTDTTVLWLDTTKEPNIMKRYDLTAKKWVNTAPTSAAELGAETPAGAKAKADAAQAAALAAAKTDAQTKADAAKQAAITAAAQDAATKSDAAKAAAIADAKLKADAAQAAAIKEAAAKATAAETAAKAHADGKVTAEEQARIKQAADNLAAAKAEAASKAAAAETAAKTAAAADAKAKADAAQAAAAKDAQAKADAAKAAAATDATNKANAAREAAKTAAAADAKAKADAALKAANDKINGLSASSRNLLLNTKNISHSVTNGAATPHTYFTFSPTAAKDIRGKEVTMFYRLTGKVTAFGTTNKWVGFELKVTYTDGTEAYYSARVETSLTLNKDYIREPFTGLAKLQDKEIKTLSAYTLARDFTGTIKLEDFMLAVGNLPTGHSIAPEDIDAEISATKSYAETKAKEAQTAATNRANAVETSVKEFASNAGNITKGTIAADRLYGGTIDAQKANIVNINAGNITTGSLDASKAKVVNLDAAAITAGLLNAARLGAGIITADKIAAKAITTDKLAVGAITAASGIIKDINAGNVVTGTLDANKVNVTNLKAQNIVSGTLDASKVTVANLSASVLQAGIIDASKVTINNLDASKITAGTLSADKIKGGSIDANNVTINNINAGKITAGTLDASKVNVTNLNAGNITGGTINAARIAANTITADKILLSDFTNLCPNPDFRDGKIGGWMGGMTAVVATDAAVPAGAPTKYVGRQSQRDGRGSDWFNVRAGDQFYISADLASKDSAHGATVGVYFFDKDGKAVSASGSGYKTKGTGAWQRHEGVVTAPANAVQAYVWTQINAFENFGNWYFTNVVVRRKAGAELIVDGSITTNKINAAGISADKITTGKLDANKVTVANLSASVIQTGVLDAAKVQVNNLSASRITSGTMSADRITGGKIDANAVNIINLKAQNIASGTINADKVTISNGKVAINSAGVTVTDSDFSVKDAKTGFTHSLRAQSNLIGDHSFEMLSADGDIWGQYYRYINWEFITEKDSYQKWARVGSPRMVDGYNTDVPDDASAFGRKAVLVNSGAYVFQDIPAKAGKKYAISFHASKPFAIGAGAPQVAVEYLKGGIVVSSEVKNFAIPATPAGEFVRYGFVITTPTTLTDERDNRIRLRFRVNGAEHTLIDGVQAVMGDKSVPYDSEDSIWMMSNARLSPVRMQLRNLIMQGNTRIEGGGLSVAGQNINGVGIEMSEVLRMWGKMVDVRGSYVSAEGFQSTASRPAGVDRMLWIGWHNDAGNAIYVHTGGSWKAAVRL